MSSQSLAKYDYLVLSLRLFYLNWVGTLNVYRSKSIVFGDNHYGSVILGNHVCTYTSRQNYRHV